MKRLFPATIRRPYHVEAAILNPQTRLGRYLRSLGDHADALEAMRQAAPDARRDIRLAVLCRSEFFREFVRRYRAVELNGWTPTLPDMVDRMGETFGYYDALAADTRRAYAAYHTV
jgi:hypothetical protein